MLLVDDVQQVNTIARNVLNCLDNAVETKESKQSMVVDKFVVELAHRINPMNRTDLHPIIADQCHDLNALSIFPPENFQEGNIISSERRSISFYLFRIIEICT